MNRPQQQQLFPYDVRPPKGRRRTPAAVSSRRRVDDDPRWRAFTGVKGVDPIAHLLAEPTPFQLADRALCGQLGRALTLLGTQPNACPKCRALRLREKNSRAC